MQDCDVVIVGAGAVGGAIAYEIAARGASVTLVDCRGAGLGATHAAAGMLVPYIEGCGKPILKMGIESLSMYDDFVERVQRDSRRRIGYQRSGSLQVTTADETLEELTAAAACASAQGASCQMLDAKQTRDAEPQLTPEVAAGLLIADHGFVVARELAEALTAAARERGARVRIPERVHRVSRSGGCLDVQLERDTLSARHVVLAAGTWSGQIALDGVPTLPVRPVRGQLLQLSSGEPPLRRITWGSRCYLVPAGPESLLAGATMEEAGFDERATVAGVRDLLDAATDLVPQLWQHTFAGARAGLRPATPDELPIVGSSRRLPGLVFATGHFRNGVLLAPLTGRAIADLVLDGRADPIFDAASPHRFGEF